MATGVSEHLWERLGPYTPLQTALALGGRIQTVCRFTFDLRVLGFMLAYPGKDAIGSKGVL